MNAPARKYKEVRFVISGDDGALCITPSSDEEALREAKWCEETAESMLQAARDLRKQVVN